VLVRYLVSTFAAWVHADDVRAPPDGEDALAAAPMTRFDKQLLAERLERDAAGGGASGHGAGEEGEEGGAEVSADAAPRRRRGRKRKLRLLARQANAAGACAPRRAQPRLHAALTRRAVCVVRAARAQPQQTRRHRRRRRHRR
jgi:hypothetical protein